jgi:hypothetical protein
MSHKDLGFLSLELSKSRSANRDDKSFSRDDKSDVSDLSGLELGAFRGSEVENATLGISKSRSFASFASMNESKIDTTPKSFIDDISSKVGSLKKISFLYPPI